MEKDTSIQVIYIAGNGHSGSTLLDIIFGSDNNCFSAGELTNITRSTIMEEYCSCKKTIPECEIWSQVIDLWGNHRDISYKEYQILRNKFERNKTTIRTFYNSLWPTPDFKRYCQATLQLLQAIKKVTGKSIIIDSSKTPQRIAILSEIVDLKVVHICRDFTGVLNSSKGSAKKNIKAGIEEDNPPRRTRFVLRDWIVTNFITEIFCMGKDSEKVFYRNFVSNPELLGELHSTIKKPDRNENFTPYHIMAGNALRMKDTLKINPEVGFLYKKINERQRKFGQAVDKIFPFWN